MSASHSSISIVGGSAAGLYAARELANRGRAVTVLETAPTLAPSPRTLVVTCRLTDVVAHLPPGVIVNEIRRFELFSNGHTATVALRRPDLVIERSTLIRGLADQARAAGARILTNHRVTHLEPSRDRVHVLVDGNGRGDAINATTVIGADGAFSGVSRAIGWPAPVTVPLVQAVVKLPRDLASDVTRVWFVPDDTPYFYWLIPDSPTTGAVGLIGEDGRQTRECLERFMAKRGLEPIAYQAARIPVYERWMPARRVGSGDVHLVGDAAAHVKVTTIGGIVTGLKGAAGVVEQILSGQTRQLSALRRELDRHRLIRRALHRLGEREYSRMLELLHPRSQRVLAEHTRDETHRVLLGLLMREPRFLLVGLRALIVGRPPRPACS